MTITKIIAENFRCFRKIEARLAPLTLLVGENSTGKTSFLALMRALLDSGYGSRTPDFREPPYDLGTFREIAHSRGARGGSADRFSGAIETRWSGEEPRTRDYHAMFVEQASFAVPTVHRYATGDMVFTERESDFTIETASGKWSGTTSDFGVRLSRTDGLRFPALHVIMQLTVDGRRRKQLVSENGTGSPPSKAVIDAALQALRPFFIFGFERPYCSAPVRTRPLRNYDPLKLTADPEGEHVPTYLAELSLRDPEQWAQLRDRLVSFGSRAGLFDELRVARQSGSGGSAFQIQIKKHAFGKKGPWRNLIDVGYGVSQALPFLTEMHRHDGAPMFFLQQPEVHLHPQAQAELGSLLCEVSASGRQVIVETHSDHLMDRVRMDVRDGTTKLTPKDVSLLFFERGDLDVNVHSIKFGRTGAVIGAPEGYRQFFMDELDRSITV